MMEEGMLEWIEGHARENGFTDQRHTMALVAEVRRLQALAAQCAPAPEKRDPYDIGKGGSRGWEASNYETLVRE